MLEAAIRLLIVHGYHRFHFGMIADELSCTRANIHYHFGTKAGLVEEAVLEYVADTERVFRGIWLDCNTSLIMKLLLTKDHNHQRYLRFNPTEATGHPWSLIARMRGSQEALSPKARQCLQQFGPTIEAFVREAIGLAKGKGELRMVAPVDDITLLFVNIINSAGPITQDAGNFTRLETIYLAYARIIQHAYGTEAFEENGDWSTPDIQPKRRTKIARQK